MAERKGAFRRYLRSQAHHLEPVVWVGRQGISESLLQEINDALDAHELIKVKFNSFKEQKKELAHEIESKARCELAGLIGNIAIFYRQHYDKAQRKIVIPDKFQ